MNKDVKVEFRISLGDRAILKQIAREQGITMSELLRKFVRTLAKTFNKETPEERLDRLVDKITTE